MERHQRFAPRASVIAEARRMVGSCLAEAGRMELIETAQLLVSETVTNAVVHAGTDVEVRVCPHRGGFKIAVTDGSPHAPLRRGYGPSAVTGRGLQVLEEMANAWGVEPTPPGKTVWFTLAAGAGADPETSPGRSQAPEPADVVIVRLLDVPLLLHEAWRQHAESLLREYLLASLDEESGHAAEDPVAVHAAASDAIALLGEHIPLATDDAHLIEQLTDAEGPWGACPEAVLRVPVASVPHFATLDHSLEAAVQMAGRHELLGEPTQPEVQQFHSWLCGEVRRQARGLAPTPWRPGEVRRDPSTRNPFPQWDSAKVTEAPGSLVAADDTGRIVAASQAAARTLGYGSAEELVGTRLVSIIPDRFRQGHVAGFTLHLLTGRAPLIGRPINVPALRRDGDELPVRLHIEMERTHDARMVFIAELDADQPDPDQPAPDQPAPDQPDSDQPDSGDADATNRGARDDHGR